MRLSPLSQVRSAITGKNRFPVTIRQIQVADDEKADLVQYLKSIPANLDVTGAVSSDCIENGHNAVRKFH